MKARKTHPLRVVKPRLEPYGRLLTCSVCGEAVDVVEIPEEFLEAERFICGQCLKDAA